MGRSIPACAGEPPIGIAGKSRPRVYPRVCGGTHDAEVKAVLGRGLSPRVRGNPHSAARVSSLGRSIPACAGEPAGLGPPPAHHRVYPRVCGGTANPGYTIFGY